MSEWFIPRQQPDPAVEQEQDQASENAFNKLAPGKGSGQKAQILGTIAGEGVGLIDPNHPYVESPETIDRHPSAQPEQSNQDVA
jgi:hypothetical protein